MTGTPETISDAVEALMRKSRISTITTVVTALLLGGAFAVLSLQVMHKRDELNAVKAEVAANQALNKQLQDQIAQNKALLANATAQVRQATIRSYEQKLRTSLARANPREQAVLKDVIQQATAADATSSAGRVVYIQYTNEAAKPAMQALQADLVSNHGYVVPGIEHVDRTRLNKRTDNVVRYFWQDDAALAKSLAGTVTASLSKTCPKLAPVHAAPKANAYKNPRPSLPLEVWIVDGC